MASLAHKDRHVTAGVDTHRDVHVAAVLNSATGKRLEIGEFPSTQKGLTALETWLRSHGHVDKVGIEGTGAYGAGLARHLHGVGIEVVEVDRPNRKTRRQRGKSDPIDAEAAARAALSGVATGRPKSHDGIVEAIRPLLVIYTSAVKDRTRAINQFKALVITADGPLRAELAGLKRPQQLAHAKTFTLDDELVVDELRWSLRELALRIDGLDAQVQRIDERLTPLVAKAAPALLGSLGLGIHVTARLLVTVGDNPDRMRSEAAFAHLCGVAPIPASSGQTHRHRLNQGGDRKANNALHQIALVRMSCDPDTKAYIARRRAQGKSDRDIMRLLKRYIARQVFRLLTTAPTDLPPDGPTLRELRTNANLTLRAVAKHLGWWPSRVSSIERQIHFSTDRARAIHTAILELDNP